MTLTIQAVERGSELADAGLRAGDVVLAINGLEPRDLIDLQFDLPDARELDVQRGEEFLVLQVDGADAGGLELLEAVPGGIRECNNHCEFCFIRGLPKGLRSTLYIYDDDYRYSFLWGNFLTLTNLEESDWHRIGFQRLSPVNVSVHASEHEARKGLLNNRHAPDLIPQFERMARLGIQLNTQVVLCGGLNDGDVLERTVRELSGFFPTVQSLSVVPVGLTRFSKVKNVRRPTVEEAQAAVALCERWQAELRPRFGVGFVYPSDELYLLSGREEMPQAASYDGFPVLTNGVGMIRSMLAEWERLLSRRRGRLPEPRKAVWLSASLASPALERMAVELERWAGWRPTVGVVSNHFFGEEVTVSGLLSGKDLIATLHELPDDVEDIVLPRGAFGFDGARTLDGVTAEEVGAAHGGRVHLASTPTELFETLR